MKNEDSERRTMITPALREALTKQGENPQEVLSQYYPLSLLMEYLNEEA